MKRTPGVFPGVFATLQELPGFRPRDAWPRSSGCERLPTKKREEPGCDRNSRVGMAVALLECESSVTAYQCVFGIVE